MCLIVTKKNPKNPEKPFVATFGNKPLRRNKSAIITDKKTKLYQSSYELIRRLLTNKCELCGSDEDIQGHHVRKLRDVKKKYQGRKNPPKWALFMMKRNRKVVFVCHKCHVEIHAGRYNGRKVESRLTGKLNDIERVTFSLEGAS